MPVAPPSRTDTRVDRCCPGGEGGEHPHAAAAAPRPQCLAVRTASLCVAAGEVPHPALWDGGRLPRRGMGEPVQLGSGGRDLPPRHRLPGTLLGSILPESCPCDGHCGRTEQYETFPVPTAAPSPGTPCPPAQRFPPIRPIPPVPSRWGVEYPQVSPHGRWVQGEGWGTKDTQETPPSRKGLFGVFFASSNIFNI